MTTIEWTDETWNPVTGCSKVSQGCKHCYAERVFPRPYPGRAFTDVRTHPERLAAPLHWKKPRRIFVNSMSDLFHEDVPSEFIAAVFHRMSLAPQHTFQILTKRPQRMLNFMTGGRALEIPLPNVWLGVSVEDQDTADERIPLLLQTPAAVRFISAEPLLGPVNLKEYLSDQRRVSISCPGSARLVFDRERRIDHETRGVSRGWGGVDDMDRSEASGNERFGERRLSTDHVSSHGPAALRRRASDRLDVLQQETHTGADGNKSHRREQDQSPPGEPGVGDQAGKCEARDSSSGQTTEGTRRQRQQRGESDGAAGDGDSSAMGQPSPITTRDRAEIQSHAERRVGNCDPQKLAAYRLDWVIAGGESGPKARPSHPDWFRSLRDQCAAAGVSFFFKQWGEWIECSAEEMERANPLANRQWIGDESTGTEVKRLGKKAAGRTLDGRTHDEYPEPSCGRNVRGSATGNPSCQSALSAPHTAQMPSAS